MAVIMIKGFICTACGEKYKHRKYSLDLALKPILLSTPYIACKMCVTTSYKSGFQPKLAATLRICVCTVHDELGKIVSSGLAAGFDVTNSSNFASVIPSGKGQLMLTAWFALDPHYRCARKVNRLSDLPV